MNVLSVLATSPRSESVPGFRAQQASMLEDIPSKIIFSFGDAISLLEKNPFAYDAVVTTFTPDDLLRNVAGIIYSRFPEHEYDRYNIARMYMTSLLKLSPFLAIVVYSGAVSSVQAYAKAEFGERLQWVQKQEPHLLTEDKKAIQIEILAGLCEYELSLGDHGAYEVIQRTSPTPLTIKSMGAFDIIVKPHFSSRRVIYPKEIEEFEWLINKPKVSERELQLFLETHKLFLLGNRYKSLRAQIHLRRDEENMEPLIPDFMLEPVSPTDLWRIVELKLPNDKITRIINDNRKGFNTKVLQALQQLREYQDYFDNPVYRQRMRDIGISAFRPEVSVVIGKDYGGLSLEEIVKARTDLPGLEVLTYKELLERAKRMRWPFEEM